MRINGYRMMWVIVMFDLPVDTKKARYDYTQFRKRLLEDGFQQMQYSVYTRACPSRENADVHVQRIQSSLPPDGEVRLLVITDKQYERMLIFWGSKRQTIRHEISQLQLF